MRMPSAASTSDSLGVAAVAPSIPASGTGSRRTATALPSRAGAAHSRLPDSPSHIVIGDQQRIGSVQIPALPETTSGHPQLGGSQRFSIHAHHLLAGVVCHAGEDARFRNRRIGLILQHSTGRNSLVTEKLGRRSFPVQSQSAPTGSTLTRCDRVGAAPGRHGALAMLQDQHRRLA